ncbi:hypothetical protein QOZ80_6AG0524470 [Eleusine coracana subsp. coracana]|nr:hypothetical protein QOZ80_6AG0524470 [Eleusine coracana subsp. coracana]
MEPLLRVLLLVQLLLQVPEGVHGAGSIGKMNISAIYIFGDSIVDPGNNNNRITEAKANFPPYGQDFPGGIATGRFSNGLVPGDMLASKLGVKELLPPYLGHNLQLNDLLTGVAFASGGSGYDPLTSTLSTAISNTGQLELFQDYKEKLTALVGEEEMTRVISQGVFFTVMGANDIANNYFTVPLRRHQYDVSSYVDFLVSSAVNFTMTLNDMGAKRIGFVGIPPMGCCPSQRTLAGGPSSECEPLRNQASALFNTRISREIDRLNAERNIYGSKFAYIDIYYNLLDLIQNPTLYGFTEVSEGCCGSTVLNAAIFIAYHSACPNAIDYIFWDGFHPTEKAYDIVVDKLIQQNMKYLM